MAILISNEICSAVKAELEAAQHSVQVISAYCKNDAISAIDGFINPGIHDKNVADLMSCHPVALIDCL